MLDAVLMLDAVAVSEHVGGAVGDNIVVVVVVFDDVADDVVDG